MRSRFVATTLSAMLVVTPLASAQVQTQVACPATSSPTAWSGTTLEIGTTRDGTVYSASGGGRLELAPSAGLFSSTALGISDLTVFSAAADFDLDGWTDFAGAGEGSDFLRIYENHTYENPEPNWSNPNAIRTPKFVIARTLISPVSDHKWRPLAAADFDGDGWPDVFRAEAQTYQRPTEAKLWLNKASNDSNGYPRFDSPYTAIGSPSQMGYQTWGGSGIMPYDYNGDRKMDLLVASGEDNGEIRVFTNQCSTAGGSQPAAPAPLRCGNKPTFEYTATLISNLGFGTHVAGGFPQFAYGKFNNDSYPDLIVASSNCCSSSSNRLRLIPGKASGSLDTSSIQQIPSVGGGSAILGADFSGDGKMDLIVASDGNANSLGVGGIADYYVNNGTSQPFSGGKTKRITSRGSPSNDYDIGFIFDYDHDPEHTWDAMVADGNNSANYYVFANRYVDQYVDCGEAASGVIPLGALQDSEMTVTGARITPSQTLNGGSITYYLSNELPANWVQATACPGSTTDLCVTFPKNSGRDVAWKAEMCSNSTHTKTPVIASVNARFDYTMATEHYRSGVVVNDGVSYVGAFRQPGDRGKFYAVNAGLDETYWEFGEKLDAQSDATRNIFTSHKDTGARLPFTYSGNTVNAGLRATLGAANSAEAKAVIDWVRSARFGVGNTGIEKTKLGAVETSTPAVLTQPSLPNWYVFADTSQRARVDAFLASAADRWSLVLFGSKDGMVHAVRTKPTDITNAANGTEAWAYIPPDVAAGFISDYANDTITSYPDGSPTLADVADEQGNLSTIALIGGGNGGKGIAALEVTNTINPASQVVSGPNPLWSTIPGGAAAGQSFTKPSVGRVKIGNAARFIAVAATGVAFGDTSPPSKGRLVYAYDALTGDVLWKFQAKCSVTSDLTMFETDDELEPGAPEIDGFIDRVVFADSCGYVYKLDPAKDLGEAWNDNAGLGAILTEVVGGTPQYALFSSKLSAGALGREAPIAGTIGAQSEAGSNRVALFFGTGGIETEAPGLQNHFYAVYADTGEMRAKVAGACAGGKCEKFYGGVVVTEDQVILTKSVDPVVGSGTCDLGTSKVQAIQINGLDNGQFITDFTTSIGSSVMGALYGDAGALYFATLGGDVVRIGTPRAEHAGGDSTSGAGSGTGNGNGNGNGNDNGNGNGSGGGFDPSAPMTLMGWRQVF